MAHYQYKNGIKGHKIIPVKEILACLDQSEDLMNHLKFDDTNEKNEVIHRLWSIKNTLQIKLDTYLVLDSVNNLNLFDRIIEIEDLLMRMFSMPSSTETSLLTKYLTKVNSLCLNCLDLLVSSGESEKSLAPSDFYETRIKAIAAEKETLFNDIENLKKQINAGDSETTTLQKQLEDKEVELQKKTNLITQYENETEQSSEQEKIKIKWENNIKDSFTSLKTTLNPIEKEYSILHWLFGIYSILIIFLLISIIGHTFQNNRFEGLTDKSAWVNFVSAMAPIPILLGLLWGFIVQLNKVQRQKFILAKQIHAISYIEQLLLAVNNLSMDTDSSSKRVNLYLDKLIDNCLSHNDDNSYSEESLVKADAKDAMHYESIIKLIKEIKPLVSK